MNRQNPKSLTLLKTIIKTSNQAAVCKSIYTIKRTKVTTN